MTTVLYTNSTKKLSRHTASFVALLIAVFITFEAPYSGMSMNPARTFASAIIAAQWKSFWLYCIAPPLGMLMAELFVLKILHKDLKHVTLHNDRP
jgi:aquaporin Z